MRTDLVRAYFNLPTVREFIQSVVDVLAERRSVVVLLPQCMDVNLIKQAVWGELWAREFSMREFSLGDIHQALPLGDLIDAFQPEWSPPDVPRTLDNFMDISLLPDVIGLWGIESCTSEYISSWMQFLRDWASLSHLRANGARQGRAICLIAHAEKVLDSIPENDIFLEVRWWWGFPSMLENSLLCRQGGGNPRKPIDQWREKLLPSLAGGDLLLFDHLWNDISCSFDELMNRLEFYDLEVISDYEDYSDWKSSLSSGEASESLSIGTAPPRKIQGLWAKGLVYSTPEFGTEIHPTVLARSLDREEIIHRIWRGQIELILPLIDSLRLKFCSLLTQSLGREWPWRWESPVEDYETDAVKENPMATQLGHLSHLIQDKNEFRNFRQWTTSVRLASSLRNKIAHYCIVNFKDFETISRYYFEFIRE